MYAVPSDQSTGGTLGGAGIPINLSAPGQNAQITFTGTQNHKLSIAWANGNFAGTFNAGCKLTVKEPTGVVLDGNENCFPTSGFLDIGTLPLSGTYTVIIDPTGNTTGGTSVQLYDDTDVTLSIAADGTSHTVTTTVPGQNAYLNFPGSSGQRIFGVINSISGYTGLGFTFSQLTEGTAHSTLRFGTQDGGSFNICGSGGGTCTVETLPATDTYSIFLNPNGMDVGSATVTLYTVPADFTTTIGTTGTPVTVVTTTPGQNGLLTFDGNSGKSLSLSLTGGTYPSSHCLLSIKRPDNSTLASGLDCSGSTHSFGPYSLTQTGTYTILIDPQYAAIGSVSVSATAN